MLRTTGFVLKQWGSKRYLIIALSLPLNHKHVNMYYILPSLTFILAEGFETAECGLIPSTHLREAGTA